MALPDDILQRTPEEAARRIALGLLADARAAAQRLEDPDDREALHDFRVAVRRLRSNLRGWRGVLGGAARKRDRKALAGLQDATSGGRDAEVALEWLAQERPHLHSQHRRGLDWVARSLTERHRKAMAHVRERLRPAFERIDERLARRLAVMRFEAHLLEPQPGETFAESLADRARDEASRLAALLASIESAEDRRFSHRARISAKRLRYLLEPVRRHAAGASAVVKRMKRLQDVLGDLHDAHVLREELGAAVETAMAEEGRRLHALARAEDARELRRAARRTERPGLLELTRRVQARIERHHRDFREEWLSDGGASLVEEVEALAARLERAGRQDLEIERKYLLSHLPELPEAAEVLEVDQGWLPGERLRERVRRIRSDEGTRYFRTIKLGQGITRVEIEETASAEVFEPLWDLTKDRRVRKRRYIVPDGDHLWEIDEFLDRELVLAEVELTSASEDPPLPGWLADCVVREVTDDARYTNFELARSGERTPGED